MQFEFTDLDDAADGFPVEWKTLEGDTPEDALSRFCEQSLAADLASGDGVMLPKNLTHRVQDRQGNTYCITAEVIVTVKRKESPLQ